MPCPTYGSLSAVKGDHSLNYEDIKSKMPVAKKTKKQGGGLSTIVVVMVPAILFVCGLCARIWYLHVSARVMSVRALILSCWISCGEKLS
jgi:hypothetical protein